jgi:SAM-dependent methyltransferase
MPLPENCIFYQTIELPEVGVIAGSWDHRETADVFLGHVNFKQKSVLDVGPANGFFSFEMEKRGAQVTAIDLGQNSPWDVVPHPFLDEETLAANMRQNVRMVENAFWYSHKALKSKVQLVYGSVYDVPKKLQSVDIALMSNVLQHFRDPLHAIQRVSQVVKETLVITETLWYDDPRFFDSASMRLIPRAETPEVNHSWWQASPSFVMELLKLLGFPEMKCEIHSQKFNGASADHDARMVKHYTITAKRPQVLEEELSKQLSVGYASGFHELEHNDKHQWRWCSGSKAEITISNSNSRAIPVSLSFGLSSITPDIAVTVVINGQLEWQGSSFYGPRPVFIANVILAPGRNTVELVTTGSPTKPTTKEQRTLSLKLYDFEICKPSS